jgi:GR25 family glycosyltransferase involved in LPS biosynthesis
MNLTEPRDLLEHIRHRWVVATRRLGGAATAAFTGARGQGPHVQRIYVINLDRKADRWRRIQAELRRVKGADGRPLSDLARRFRAVEARYLDLPADPDLIDPTYTLAEQLFVQPDAKVGTDAATLARTVTMSRPEVAVALSHIGVWQRVAQGDVSYTLVLEDDGFFGRSFGRDMSAAWADVVASTTWTETASNRATCAPPGSLFDLLYVSYKQVHGSGVDHDATQHVFAPRTGLWQLSGYVLSKPGAQRLLASLPVRGPVDMWINHRFDGLRVLATRRSIVGQRRADASSNDYSILPVLAQVGALSNDKPLLPARRELPAPVFVAGPTGTGVAEIGAALSMLGYRCLTDLRELPEQERERLQGAGRGRIFDAYVNVGEVEPEVWPTLATRIPGARFITTSALNQAEALLPALLVLPHQTRDKWEHLTAFLGQEYPAHPWPSGVPDTVQRALVRASLPGDPGEATGSLPATARRMRWDQSPWIVPHRSWPGVRAEPASPVPAAAGPSAAADSGLHGRTASNGWRLRDDTFPGNLAVFTPANARRVNDALVLTVREQSGPARDYTAAAVASGPTYRYGTFSAEIQSAAAPGIVTGFFLHRNGPRQEIDVEFPGHQPRNLLVNVYYNPGQLGDKFEYGYRGTPVMVDLGFDASSDFHLYEIEWQPDVIRWRVDGRVLHERVDWAPTPIPQHPMELNINVWPTRSRELAGRLDRRSLPAEARVRGTRISGQQWLGPPTQEWATS